MNSALVGLGRAPKLVGDFGEGLVTYALIRKGFEVANVDHVGADLIAANGTVRIAVSVKTRRLPKAESKGIVIEDAHLDKLKGFARLFDLIPVFAHVACIEEDKKIHLFMVKVEDIPKLRRAQHGYSLRFSKKQLAETKALSFVDYSCWGDESIGTKLFTAPA